MARSKFSDGSGFCSECGAHERLHTTVFMSDTWITSHCPDLSLPLGEDDDPWEEPAVQPKVSALFDPYD